jgi:hypothetical protein
MKMHTDEQCAQKLKGIKMLSERIQLSIKDKGEAFFIAESISAMCDELLREFEYDKY